jgi:hypothetical protein
MKTAKVVAALLLAFAVLAAAAGCSKDRGRTPTVPVAVASAPPDEPLTPKAAERAFRTYANNDDVARASGDERLALTWTADGQSALMAAEYRLAAFRGDPVPRYTYGKPTLYVPRLTTYPRWFVAITERTPRPSTAEPRPEPHTAIMAFIKRGPSDTWRLSLTSKPAGKAKLPKIEVAADGYATPLATTDASLLIPPRSVPSIHGAVADEGPGSVPARNMKPGPSTTGLYERTQQAKKKAKNLVVNTVFPATLFPIFPLRTADGGGFVLYALTRDTQTYVKEHDGVPPVPADAEHLVDTLEFGDELHVFHTLQFAAYDPPKTASKRKAEVLAAGGAATKVDVKELKSHP